MEARSSYLAGDILRNDDRVKRLLGEAAADEIPARAWPPAASGDHALCPEALRLQPPERTVDEIRIDAAPLEIGSDQHVAGGAIRESCCACVRETLVVEVAGANE